MLLPPSGATRSPITPQKGQYGPCGQRIASKCTRAASRSVKIGLVRSTGRDMFNSLNRLDNATFRVFSQGDNSPRKRGREGWGLAAAASLQLALGLQHAHRVAQRGDGVFELGVAVRCRDDAAGVAAEIDPV